MNTEQARFNMIEQQIRPWNVLRADILKTLAQVPREAFVPEHLRALAFCDTTIPLGHGACMMEPRMEARLVHDLALTGQERVLEIGTGSGYSAALLAHHARAVVTVEIEQSLAAAAAQRLQAYANVEVLNADGANTEQLAKHGPFDAIVLSGSVDLLPESLLGLLTPHGRLLAICGEDPIMHATLVQEHGGHATREQLWDASAPRLCHFESRPAFSF